MEQLDEELRQAQLQQQNLLRAVSTMQAALRVSGATAEQAAELERRRAVLRRAMEKVRGVKEKIAAKEEKRRRKEEHQRRLNEHLEEIKGHRRGEKTN